MLFPPHVQIKIEHDMNWDDWGLFCDKLESGTMVKFAPKSSSCDAIVKVAKNCLIEFQFKSGKKKISRAVAKEEIEKSMVLHSKGYKSLFVILCASGFAGEASSISSLSPDHDIKVHIPTTMELEHFFGKKLLTKFQSSPGD